MALFLHLCKCQRSKLSESDSQCICLPIKKWERSSFTSSVPPLLHIPLKQITMKVSAPPTCLSCPLLYVLPFTCKHPQGCKQRVIYEFFITSQIFFSICKTSLLAFLRLWSQGTFRKFLGRWETKICISDWNVHLILGFMLHEVLLSFESTPLLLVNLHN